MATITEKDFAQIKVASIAAATPTTIYTATATDVVKTLVVTNIHTADVTVTLWKVPNGGSANVDADKIFFNATTIPVNDFVQISTYIPLNVTGMKFVAICSVTNGVNISLAGASLT
jgi:hypothetical protein